MIENKQVCKQEIEEMWRLEETYNFSTFVSHNISKISLGSLFVVYDFMISSDQKECRLPNQEVKKSPQASGFNRLGRGQCLGISGSITLLQSHKLLSFVITFLVRKTVTVAPWPRPKMHFLTESFHL